MHTDHAKELPSEKGDIKAWLRRRAGNDLVMMGGQLAGEIADHIEQQEAEIAMLRKDAERKTTQIDALLQHCADAECHTCGSIICRHGEPLHFHHDGCPACASDTST